ncbi:MAG: hypothetical protein ABEK50_06520, partial [bacterium]
PAECGIRIPGSSVLFSENHGSRFRWVKSRPTLNLEEPFVITCWLLSLPSIAFGQKVRIPSLEQEQYPLKVYGYIDSTWLGKRDRDVNPNLSIRPPTENQFLAGRFDIYLDKRLN